jgi:hypothetical protein
VEPVTLFVLLCVWMAASTSSGFLLALLGKRVHPTLSTRRLWLFYTLIMASLVALVFIVTWV